MNTNQVGQNMRGERNEHSMESEMEGIRKGYLYISALLFQIKKKRIVVPVPLSPVPVPLVQKVAVAIRYRDRRANLG